MLKSAMILAAAILTSVRPSTNIRAIELTLPTRTISEAGAEEVITAAEHEATKLHAPCAIAVVDGSGILVLFKRMDGVRPGSPDLAIGKAKTSALLRRPSAETETNVNNGRTAFVTSGFLALRGGMPLTVGNDTVGAVGVAGLNKDNDDAIATAAAAAYTTAVQSRHSAQ